jgi:hypothetical protein
VHEFPSLQDALVGLNTHPLALSHESDVHGLPSSQTAVVPSQIPSMHESAMVHKSPSLHAAPS